MMMLVVFFLIFHSNFTNSHSVIY